MSVAAAVDGQMPAGTSGATCRHHGRCRGNVGLREGNMYVTAVPARTRAIRRDGAGIQHLASLDADLPARRTVGVKLAAVDENARGHRDRARVANAPRSDMRWPSVDAAGRFNVNPIRSNQGDGAALQSTAYRDVRRLDPQRTDRDHILCDHRGAGGLDREAACQVLRTYYQRVLTASIVADARYYGTAGTG